MQNYGNYVIQITNDAMVHLYFFLFEAIKPAIQLTNHNGLCTLPMLIIIQYTYIAEKNDNMAYDRYIVCGLVSPTAASPFASFLESPMLLIMTWPVPRQ